MAKALKKKSKSMVPAKIRGKFLKLASFSKDGLNAIDIKKLKYNRMKWFQTSIKKAFKSPKPQLGAYYNSYIKDTNSIKTQLIKKSINSTIKAYKDKVANYEAGTLKQKPKMSGVLKKTTLPTTFDTIRYKNKEEKEKIGQKLKEAREIKNNIISSGNLAPFFNQDEAKDFNNFLEKYKNSNIEIPIPQNSHQLNKLKKLVLDFKSRPFMKPIPIQYTGLEYLNKDFKFPAFETIFKVTKPVFKITKSPKPQPQ